MTEAPTLEGASGGFPAPSNNQFLRNNALSNGASNLVDLNASCGTDVWHGNHGPPASPPCTLNP